MGAKLRIWPFFFSTGGYGICLFLSLLIHSSLAHRLCASAPAEAKPSFCFDSRDYYPTNTAIEVALTLRIAFL